MRKRLPPALIFMVLFAGTEMATAQSLRDSIITATKYFYDSTNDEALKKTLTEAQALYQNNLIGAPLAAKLVAAENLMLTDPRLNLQAVFNYAEMLERSLFHLPNFMESPAYAGSLHNLAKVYARKGLYKKALPLYEQALNIRKKVLGDEHPDYASTLDNLGLIHRSIGAIEKGMSLCEQARAIRKKILGEKHSDYAISLHNLSGFYLDMEQFQSALEVIQQALTIRRNVFGEKNADYANSLHNLAIIYDRMGEYEKSISVFLKVLAIKKETLGEEHPDYASSLSGLALEYEQIGDFEKALPLSLQAAAIRKKVWGVEHPQYVLSLHNLAGIYLKMGQIEKAMPIDQEALLTTKKMFGEEHPEFAISLNNLATIYVDLGEYEKALPLYQQALAVIKKIYGEESYYYLGCLFNMASLYKSVSNYERALALLSEVLRITKKVRGEENAEYAIDINLMASIYAEMGDDQKALPLFEQALTIVKKAQGEEHPDYATVEENLAGFNQHRGQYTEALTLFKHALNIRKKISGEKHYYTVNCLNGIAQLYALSGHTTEALSLIQEASTIELNYLAITYSSLTEQEKIKLLSKEFYQFSYMPSLMLTKKVAHPALLQQLYTNELTLKGMVLENQKQVLHAIRQSEDSSDLLLYEQWRLNKNLVGRQYILPMHERTANTDSLEDVSNLLEQQLSRRFTAFRNGMQNITQKDISRKLHKDEAAIEFMQFKLYNKKWTDSILYAALISLPGDTNVHMVPLFEEKQLQHLLSPSSKKLNNYALIQKLYPGKLALSALKDSLYLLVWKPLEKYLNGIHTVYFAPTGLLHRVCFNALQPDANHLLIDKYRLTQLFSTRSVALPAQIDSKPVSAGLWGNIEYSPQAGDAATRSMETGRQNYDTTAASFNFYASDSRGSRGGDWRNLSGTKKEMDNIGAVLVKSGINMTMDSGATATEEAFKLLDGKSPKVLHLATHGFFLPVPVAHVNHNAAVPDENAFTVQQNPMFRSGLILSGGNYAWKGGTALPGKEDGILTAYEIAQMDLSNTDLVVLSACETALGDIQGNEGVIGLQRAFKMAGVKQLIVSLWRIPDKETTELMTLFYGNWLHGQSTRDALRAAQMTMKAKYPPYYWASFVLME